MTSGGTPGASVRRRLSEDQASYEAERATFAEAELVALWLLGRVPESVVPWPLLRAGRAGRGAGPDVREAAFRDPTGVPLTGDVEVHLRASDYVQHGHATDPAYDEVVLHLVWEDDRGALAGTPTRLAGGALVPTVAVAPALGGDPDRLRQLVRRGPSGAEPCGVDAVARDHGTTLEIVRAEGRRRTAERAWRAARLVELRGWDGAWAELLVRSLRASAGRRAESEVERDGLATAVTGALGDRLARELRRLALEQKPGVLIEGLRRSGQPGRARATEIGWNAVLPLLAADAAAYGDTELARAVAILIDRWPAPRPYGRTDALQRLIARDDERPTRRGALYAQGLLHLQDLWCERGGCGVCPLSAAADLAHSGSRG